MDKEGSRSETGRLVRTLYTIKVMAVRRGIGADDAIHVLLALRSFVQI